MWRKTIKHTFSLFFTLIKHGFLTNKGVCRVLSVIKSHISFGNCSTDWLAKYTTLLPSDTDFMLASAVIEM